MAQYYQEHAAAFVELLTGNLNEVLHFQLFYDPKDGSKRRDLAKQFPATLAQAKGVIERAEVNMQGVYVCLNETDRRDRNTHNITKIRALFADFDNQHEPAWTLPPHFVTKRDETHGHAFWLVSDVDVDEFMYLQRRIATAMQTDYQVVDPARVVRLPGTLHLKDPLQPKMYYVAANNGLTEKYTKQQIINGFTLTEEQSAEYDKWRDSRESLNTGTGFEDSQRYREKFTKFLTTHAEPAVEGSGSATLIRVCNYAHDHGLPLQVAQDLAWEHFNPRCMPPWSDSERNQFEAIIERGYKYARNKPGCKTAAAAFIEASALPPIPKRIVHEIIRNGDRFTSKQAELVKGMCTAKTAHYELAQVLDGLLYDGCKLLRSSDQFYEYDGRKWILLEDSYVKSLVQRFLSEYKPNDTLVNGVFKSLRDLVNIRQVQNGTWLDNQSPADNVINFKNGIVDMSDDRAQVIEHSPNLFTFTSLSYDYDPAAICPKWEAFLADIFSYDLDLVLQLQEWFGYCLTNDTSMQKFGLFIGQPRAGKGVITTILSALVGQENTSAPTLAKLNNDSTLFNLSTSSLALIPDAHSVSINLRDSVLSNFKAITGGDPISYHVMYKGTKTSVLKVKFLMSTNNMPEFNDPSGAFASRMLVFPFKKSFIGREDFNLVGKLGHELNGIAQWAIKGYRRLKAQGRFTQAKMGLKRKNLLEYDMNPLSEFIETHCVVNPDKFTSKYKLYEVYLLWCKQVKINMPLSPQKFTRDINSSGLNLEHDRAYTDSGREWGWWGLEVKNVFSRAKELPGPNA